MPLRHTFSPSRTLLQLEETRSIRARYSNQPSRCTRERTQCQPQLLFRRKLWRRERHRRCAQPRSTDPVDTFHRLADYWYLPWRSAPFVAAGAPLTTIEPLVALPQCAPKEFLLSAGQTSDSRVGSDLSSLQVQQ